jgi:hypothetical protein
LGTEEERESTFRSSTDEIFETPTWNNKNSIKKRINVLSKYGSTEHSKGNKRVPEKVATTRTEDRHKQTTKTSTTI